MVHFLFVFIIVYEIVSFCVCVLFVSQLFTLKLTNSFKKNTLNKILICHLNLQKSWLKGKQQKCDFIRVVVCVCGNVSNGTFRGILISEIITFSIFANKMRAWAEKFGSTNLRFIVHRKNENFKQKQVKMHFLLADIQQNCFRLYERMILTFQWINLTNPTGILANIS